MAIWLCGYVAMWLKGYVAEWSPYPSAYRLPTDRGGPVACLGGPVASCFFHTQWPGKWLIPCWIRSTSSSCRDFYEALRSFIQWDQEQVPRTLPRKLRRLPPLFFLLFMSEGDRTIIPNRCCHIASSSYCSNHLTTFSINIVGNFVELQRKLTTFDCVPISCRAFQNSLFPYFQTNPWHANQITWILELVKPSRSNINVLQPEEFWYYWCFHQRISESRLCMFQPGVLRIRHLHFQPEDMCVLEVLNQMTLVVQPGDSRFDDISNQTFFSFEHIQAF